MHSQTKLSCQIGDHLVEHVLQHHLTQLKHRVYLRKPKTQSGKKILLMMESTVPCSRAHRPENWLKCIDNCKSPRLMSFGHDGYLSPSRMRKDCTTCSTGRNRHSVNTSRNVDCPEQAGFSRVACSGSTICNGSFAKGEHLAPRRLTSQAHRVYDCEEVARVNFQ